MQNLGVFWKIQDICYDMGTEIFKIEEEMTEKMKPKVFAFWMSLKVVMAVFPQNTIFFETPCIFFSFSLTLYSKKEQGKRHCVSSIILSFTNAPTLSNSFANWVKSERLLQRGNPSTLNCRQWGWQPTLSMMVRKTHCAKLKSRDVSHGLSGLFIFSCRMTFV